MRLRWTSTCTGVASWTRRGHTQLFSIQCTKRPVSILGPLLAPGCTVLHLWAGLAHHYNQIHSGWDLRDERKSRNNLSIKIKTHIHSTLILGSHTSLGHRKRKSQTIIRAFEGPHAHGLLSFWRTSFHSDPHHHFALKIVSVLLCKSPRVYFNALNKTPRTWSRSA